MITILRRAVTKRCPYRPETDTGELTITIDGPAPELHQLGVLIDGVAAAPVTHEDYTAKVLALLPPGSEVMTTWRTGPWSVEVREGSAVVREPVNGSGA